MPSQGMRAEGCIGCTPMKLTATESGYPETSGENVDTAMTTSRGSWWDFTCHGFKTPKKGWGRQHADWLEMCSTDYIEPSLAPSKVIGIYSCAVQRSSPANSKAYSKNHSGGEAVTQPRVKGAMAPPSTVPPPRIPRVGMLQAKLKVKKPVDLVCGNKQASEPTAAELATIVASISTSLEKSMGSRGKQQAASSKWQTRAVTTDDQLNTLRGSTESWTKRVGLVADEKDSICAS